MDIEYIQNQTFWGDIKIIIQTVLVMVFKKGAY
jgi:lipopolysaccharide/colanic/teichoic acid biosynthesis glycosyltransferase